MKKDSLKAKMDKEKLHGDGKLKLSGGSGQHGEERQDQERNESTLWLALWTTSDNQANKG